MALASLESAIQHRFLMLDATTNYEPLHVLYIKAQVKTLS
jgi:hypothetical protein